MLLALIALSGLTPTPRIVVVGGTHGNEFTGVYIIKQLQQVARRKSLEEEYPSLRIETVLANPRAYEDNRRFVDDDLNRQFTLPSTRGDSYEAMRANELDAELGPKGSPSAADFIIDLHTTTANMGCTIIVNSYCKFALRIAAYLASVWAGDDACNADAEEGLEASLHPLRVYLHEVTHEAAPYLSSVGQAGLTIEVGPTPQGLLRADCVATTERALHLVLRYLELHHCGCTPETPETLRVYADRGKVQWPSDAEASALPGALIAPSLQDRDFEPLHPGAAMFVRPDGRVVRYDGVSGPVVYPVFVNEAAYYYAESGRGVGLTTLVSWPIE